MKSGPNSRLPKPRAKVPKPTGSNMSSQSKKSKIKYLNSQSSMKPSQSSRNDSLTEFSSVKNHVEKRERMHSANEEESEICNLDIERLDSIDKVSQYSIQMPKGGMKDIPPERRAHSNSFNNPGSEANPNLFTYNLLNSPQTLRLDSRISELCLSKSKLTEIPAKTFEMIFLKKLSIDNNNLTTLPSKIGRLTRLKILDFHNNKIEEIPKEVGSLISLKKISAKNN